MSNKIYNFVKQFFINVAIILFFFVSIPTGFAQTTSPAVSPSGVTKAASESATVTASPKQTKKELTDITNPEQAKQRQQVLSDLFEKRKADTLTWTNALPFAIQYAIKAGVPSNTVVLILLLPILATIIVAFRYLVGLSGIGLLVPIALSITLLATNVTPGFIMLAAIILASLASRMLLRRFPIMQMPKVAISMFMVAIFLLTALTISSIYGIIDVRNLSIFPILLFILLSDRIVALFLEREIVETIQTTVITLFLAILGFLLLTWEQLRLFILLYPEVILLLIPINILIGRYFGLRVTEYIKFQPVLKHGNK